MRFIDYRDPFPFFYFPSLCSAAQKRQLLMWLMSLDDWTRVVANYFDQFERPVSNELQTRFPDLYDRCVKTLALIAGERFGVSIGDDLDVVVIKFVAGQGLGIHTDFVRGHSEEVCRMILYATTVDLVGGELLLFASSQASALEAIVLPISGSAMVFRIDEQSFHAVSDVRKGERYSLVLRAFEKAGAAE